MLKIYNDNGLPFATADYIRDREYIQSFLQAEMERMLRRVNPAWQIERIEAPCLMPDSLLNPEYGVEDVFGDTASQLVLKPETTASSYEYARYLFDHQLAKAPLCVWQAGKSFRRENDQVAVNVRLKEFYQQEFQCIVTEDTKMDYLNFASLLSQSLGQSMRRSTRVVASDRLPGYSSKTLDIEIRTPRKWLEVCSISRRTDVPFDWEKRKLINFEFAFGLDRLTYTKRLERTDYVTGT